MGYPHGERGILMVQCFIGPDYMDAMGHMNVQYYSRLFDAATWTTFALGGIDAAYIIEKQCGMAALEQHIRYFKEIREGTIVQIWSRMKLVTPKMLRLRHQMVEAKEDTLLAELEQKAVHFDLAGRKARPFPVAIYEQIDGVAHNGMLLED